MPGDEQGSFIPDYLDFELEIGPGQGREYPLAVIHSPAGEAHASLHFPYDELSLESRLKDLKIALLRSSGIRRQFLTPEEQIVRDFGSSLFNALREGEIRSRYDISQTQAAQQNKGLRLKLRIQPPELAALPWEYLYDARRSEYICLSTQTPIIRYLDIPQPIRPLAMQPPLRILAMSACPVGLPALDVAGEKARLNRALHTLLNRGLVQITWLEEQTWRSLQRILRSGPWHIFHFVGHGRFDPATGEGQLALADEEGRLAPLGATHLARLLADHSSLRLAFLNACEGGQAGTQDPFSSIAATLVRRGLPAVLALQSAITDQGAIELAQAFYESLADGLPVDAAVSEARKSISLAIVNTLEWGVPVLYMHAPDGTIFKLPALPQKARVSKPISATLVRTEAPVAQVQPRQTITRPLPATPTLPGKATTRESILLLAPKATLEIVLISAGRCWMGSDLEKDPEAYENEELPQFALHLETYSIGKYPVTVAQFEAFVQATGYKTTAEQEGGTPTWIDVRWEWVKGAYWRHPRGPQTHVKDKAYHPVTMVSWDDALAFCRWASQVSGKELRLPTEAEWEKAACWEEPKRADSESAHLTSPSAPEGRKRKYPWGNETPDEGLCNFGNKVNDTSPVGHYSPYGDSAYGCADMAGNVWEWTSSLWGKNWVRPDFKYPFDPNDGRQELDRRDMRILRGGSYYSISRNVRCASRFRDHPYNRLEDYGFRIACSGDIH